MPFTKEQLQARRTPTRTITVPEFGEVCLRVMTLAETRQFQTTLDGDKDNAYANLLVKCLANPDGSRMYKDEEASLVAGHIEYPAASYLFDQALVMNRLKSQDKPQEQRERELADEGKS